jgi:hypothetical protein
MEQNVWWISIKARQWIARWQGKTERLLDRDAECFSQLQVSFNRVCLPIDWSNMMVKETRSLTAIAHPPKFFGATDASDQGTPKETLEIEGDIWTQCSCFHQPRPQTGRRAQATELTSRENMNVIDIGVSAEQGSPFGVNYPSDFRFGICFANGCDRRQGMDNVA